MSPNVVSFFVTPIWVAPLFMWLARCMMLVADLDPIFVSIIFNNSSPLIFTWEHTARLFKQGLGLFKCKHFSSIIMNECFGIFMVHTLASIGPMIALLLSWTHKNKCNFSKHVSITIIWIWRFLNLDTSNYFIGLEAYEFFSQIVSCSFTRRLTKNWTNLVTLFV